MCHLSKAASGFGSTRPRERGFVSFEEYQRLRRARGEADTYEQPPEIMAQVEESRRQPRA